MEASSENVTPYSLCVLPGLNMSSPTTASTLPLSLVQLNRMERLRQDTACLVCQQSDTGSLDYTIGYIPGYMYTAEEATQGLTKYNDAFRKNFASFRSLLAAEIRVVESNIQESQEKGELDQLSDEMKSYAIAPGGRALQRSLRMSDTSCRVNITIVPTFQHLKEYSLSSKWEEEFIENHRDRLASSWKRARGGQRIVVPSVFVDLRLTQALKSEPAESTETFLVDANMKMSLEQDASLIPLCTSFATVRTGPIDLSILWLNGRQPSLITLPRRMRSGYEHRLMGDIVLENHSSPSGCHGPTLAQSILRG